VTSTAPISQRVVQLMGKMSLSNEISMVEGHGTSNPYVFQFNLFSQPRIGSTSATVTTPADVAVATSVAEEGTTLLKNAGGVLPLPASGGGTVAVIGPSASASPTYAGGGSAYVIPSGTVTPLAGIQAAAGSGTNVVYSQGLPADTSLPSIPSSDLSPAYSATPSGGSYTGTLTAPQTGSYVLALTHPCASTPRRTCR
jgi:beta-glucosidase